MIQLLLRLPTIKNLCKEQKRVGTTFKTAKDRAWYRKPILKIKKRFKKLRKLVEFQTLFEFQTLLESQTLFKLQKC